MGSVTSSRGGVVSAAVVDEDGVSVVPAVEGGTEETVEVAGVVADVVVGANDVAELVDARDDDGPQLTTSSATIATETNLRIGPHP
jgi:hypothetical protein